MLPPLHLLSHAVQLQGCVKPAEQGESEERTAHVVVHASLGEHGVVLNLRLADGGRVIADDNQLGCSKRGESQHQYPRENVRVLPAGLPLQRAPQYCMADALIAVITLAVVQRRDRKFSSHTT